MSFREYQVTPEAVARGRAIGLFGNTAKRLKRAARRSAQFTSELGNRRFLHLALQVQGDTVVWVNRIQQDAA